MPVYIVSFDRKLLYLESLRGAAQRKYSGTIQRKDEDTKVYKKINTDPFHPLPIVPIE